MKIANKISISFFITGAVLTTVAGSIYYTISRHNLQNAIFEHLKTAAKSRAHHIETSLKMQKERIAQLSQSVVLESFLRTNEQDLDYIDKLDIAVRRLKKTENIGEYVYEVFVLNAKGKVIASSDRKNIGLDTSTDAYFLGAKSGPYIKDAYFSKTTGQKSIGVSAPITNRETKALLGVVVGRISLSMLNEITADRTGLGKTGEIYLINKHGYMITPSHFIKDTFLKLKVDTENTRKCLEDFKKFGVKPHEHEPLIYTDYRGVRVLGFHDHIPEMQWGLLAKIDEPEALAPLKRIKAIFLIIILFVPLVAWLIGIFIARLITGPIRMLHEGTEIIGQGNLDYKVSTGAKDEIGQLSRAFDKMTGDLKKTTTSIDKLNKEIAERKQAEEALRESEEKYRDIFENVSDFLYVHDLDGNLIDTNLAWKKEYGFSDDDLAHLNLRDLIPERYRNQFDDYLKRVNENGKDEGIIRVMRKDGRERIVEYRNSLVYDSTGPIRVRGSARDLTERKKAEEVSRKAAALETLSTVLENFIGDSLSNLLTPVYGQIELCEVRDSIEQIKSELGYAKEGITELLTGISAYRKFTKAGESSLGKISSEGISSILGPLLSGQPLKTYGNGEFPIDPSVKLRFTYDPKQKGALSLDELPSVSGSKLAIETALQETLINAVESYDPRKGGDVEVSARKEDDNLIIKIADNGRGMSDEERDKSQLPFFKVLGVKGSDRFGLGAYVALESAKYCGGDIHIESTEGAGTTASISFKVSDWVS
jgi:PAS domain S-box-containing protein